MSISIGTVKSASVAKPRNTASGKARLLQVEIGESVQTLQLVPQAGEDYNPPPGTLVVFIESGGRGFVLGTYDKIEPAASAGERVLYSSAGGAVKARIHLKADGTMELNGSSKKFVTHAELNSALQTFITALNLHTHPTAGTGAPSPPTTPMSINISGAATTTVKTGG